MDSKNKIKTIEIQIKDWFLKKFQNNIKSNMIISN